LRCVIAFETNRQLGLTATQNSLCMRPKARLAGFKKCLNDITVW